MKYCLLFHANLNYSRLEPEKFEFVIRESYEKLVDLFANRYPDARWTFEASGFTIEQMAKIAPDVLEKYKKAFKKNCEFMGSPYAHSILANVPYEDGLYSLKFGMDAYQKHLGFKPKSGWNPECSWNKTIPKMYEEAGYETLLIDWDSYLISTRPEVRAVEYDDDKTRHDGRKKPWYDADPNDKTLHFPAQLTPKLKGVMRSDRTQMPPLRYMIGEETFENGIAAIDKWAGKGDGYVVVFAEDAEYCGTSGYYFLKYHGEKRFFEHAPETIEKLIKVMDNIKTKGEFITISDAANNFPVHNMKIQYDENMAWHRTVAEAWKNTKWAHELDPMCDEVRKKIKSAEQKAKTDKDRAVIKEAWFNLIQGENSDGRWPPGEGPAQSNIDFCTNALKKAEELLKGAKLI